MRTVGRYNERSIGASDERRRPDLRLAHFVGLGYASGRFMSNAHETQHVFGVGDVGGSHAYADTRTGTTFALTKNRLAPSFDTFEHVAEIVTKAVADS
jgi:hypothetical protein